DQHDAAAIAALGRASLARGDYGSAVKLLEQALTMDPDASSLHYPLSVAYRALGDGARSDFHLRRRGTTEVRRADPLIERLSGLLDSAVTHDAAARAALARGDWTEAVAQSRRALDLAGDKPSIRAPLYHRLGSALAQTGDIAGARKEFEQAVRLD